MMQDEYTIEENLNYHSINETDVILKDLTMGKITKNLMTNEQ